MQWLHAWQTYAIGSAFFAGLTAALGKIGVEKVNSNLATLIRTVVILVLIAAVVSFRREWQKPADLPLRGVTFLILSGVATGLSWLCYYRALQMAPASRVAPIDKLSVVFAILIALVFLGETLSPRAAIGAALVSLGAILLAI